MCTVLFRLMISVVLSGVVAVYVLRHSSDTCKFMIVSISWLYHFKCLARCGSVLCMY